MGGDGLQRRRPSDMLPQRPPMLPAAMKSDDEADPALPAVVFHVLKPADFAPLLQEDLAWAVQQLPPPLHGPVLWTHSARHTTMSCDH